MKGNSSAQISMKINLLALALSIWAVVFTVTELFNISTVFRVIVSTLLSILSFIIGYHFAENSTDCTKSWDDEID